MLRHTKYKKLSTAKNQLTKNKIDNCTPKPESAYTHTMNSSLDARYLLNQIADLETKRREEQMALVEEQTRHQRTVQELSQIKEQLKLQEYKAEQLKLKLSQLEFQDLPSLRRREESIKETFKLTKGQIEVTEKDVSLKLGEYDSKMYVHHVVFHILSRIHNPETTHARQYNKMPNKQTMTFPTNEQQSINQPTRSHNLNTVLSELLDHKHKSIEYWNQLPNVQQMHQLEKELHVVEMELSSQLEARKHRLEQMRTESTSLEKENEKLKRDMRDLVIEKQVLADNIPSAMMVGDTDGGEDANRGCRDGNRSCTATVSVHQGVSTESRQNTPENHGAHDPGTEEALRNLEAQVKEMRKTVQEQETNLHTVHGYVSLLLSAQPTYCWRRTKRHTPYSAASTF